MKQLLIIGLLALTGCGTVDSFTNPQDTDYVTLSHAKAGGMYQWITGQTEACKLSKHGVTGLKYTIELKDGECSISALK